MTADTTVRFIAHFTVTNQDNTAYTKKGSSLSCGHTAVASSPTTMRQQFLKVHMKMAALWCLSLIQKKP
jgi:hypothetical protein